MERDSFIFYRSFYESIQELDDEARSQCYDAIVNYALDGIEPNDNGVVMAIFKAFKPQIDANNRRYENGKKGGEYGKRGGRPKNPTETPIKPLKNPTETPNVNVNENVNVNVNGNVIKEYSAAKQRRFTPPTLQEVTDYINSKGYSVDPQAFIDFYESKGWMIGKNKMKSWQSAIGTWERRQKRERKPNGFKEFKQNTYDFDELEKQLIQN